MKRENYYKFMYAASVLMVLGFAIRLLVDYCQYDPIGTSAPFYVDIIIDSIEYLIPALLCFIAGLVCRRKFR